MFGDTLSRFETFKEPVRCIAEPNGRVYIYFTDGSVDIKGAPMEMYYFNHFNFIYNGEMKAPGHIVFKERNNG